MAVLVVGSLHLDIVVNAPRLPALDETLVGSAVSYAFGGKGGNQAVAAARMDADVAMAGRVGADAFANRLIDELESAGVDHGGIQRGAGASGMSVAIVEAAGDYGAVIVSAENLNISPEHIEIGPHITTTCLQNEIPEAANLEAARKAREAGARVILNAAPARALSEELAQMTDILVVNRVEAQALSGDGTPSEQALALTALGCGAVIVTLGADGLVWATAGAAQQKMPAHNVKVISTHGAGDAFVGALAAALDRGADLTGAMSFAQAAAALHVSTPVDQRRTVTRSDVEGFAQTSKP